MSQSVHEAAMLLDRAVALLERWDRAQLHACLAPLRRMTQLQVAPVSQSRDRKLSAPRHVADTGGDQR